MTVQDTTIVFSSTANGVTTAFPMTNCLVYDETHIKVEVDNVLKTLATDYTVSGVGLSTGPTVNFLVAPTNGATVIRYRSVPYEQQTDLVNYEGPPLEVIESMVDLTVMQTAQLAESISRAIRFPIGENYNAEFPPLSESAGKYLYRKVDGTIGASAGTTDTPISPAMETFVASASLGDARTELDVYSTSDVYTKSEADSTFITTETPELPDQTGNSGKYLTTDGTNPSWATVASTSPIKAWVNWTAGGTTVNASFNVTSVTRASAGDYTVHFTSALPDVNYAISGCVVNATGTAFTLGQHTLTAPATTSCRLITNQTWTGSIADPTGKISAMFVR